MGHHSHGPKCSPQVRVPPTYLWNATQVVAFPNDHKFTASWEKCCDTPASNMTIYNKACFKFCNVDGNSDDVVSCMKDAGVKKATAFNTSDSDDGDDDETSGVAPVKSISKSAVGLAVIMLASLAIGTL
ncbi:hypothetical protein PHISCL_02164 [Aspergillus sclerotialis]|uniref:Uncharacterized protein n=1 Tax=Aspergillus sclerotialis TaxID=2070753 RepID=A0A3A3A7Y5_9EURO|nr:hypothetical protein PHISCL_02164 [Aspergillus sclerotialis]